MAESKRVVVGVSGGIAAYKSCQLIRLFAERGHEVRVVPTAAALEFVGRATFEALSGNPVHTGVFDDVPGVEHVKLGQQADLIVIAPATADLLARAVSGRAEDLLTATLLAARCPVMFVPAMHTEMWHHPATVANVATLRSRGAIVLEPASGRLTGVDTGPGRLPEPVDIAALANLVLDRSDALPQDLAGKRLLITAGGTREPLDPVRFLGNRSSGKQGFALARVAAQRGAHVTLVAGATTDVSPPPAVEIVQVSTAAHMREAVGKYAPDVDVIVMAAAVADFRPAQVSDAKIKKGPAEPSSIELIRNTDILAELVDQRAAGQLPKKTLIVGFAAETGDANADVLTHARRKLESKRCDLLVVNAVGDGKAFECDVNTGWILGPQDKQLELSFGSKDLMSSRILDAIRNVLDY